mmetsp:Transcript_47465/g.117510  ORF Transcript_47465/g.117510 Transcript_47465/m.117510 type:complete len:298 (+) Transcript_47465:370-1263(+)
MARQRIAVDYGERAVPRAQESLIRPIPSTARRLSIVFHVCGDGRVPSRVTCMAQLDEGARVPRRSWRSHARAAKWAGVRGVLVHHERLVGVHRPDRKLHKMFGGNASVVDVQVDDNAHREARVVEQEEACERRVHRGGRAPRAGRGEHTLQLHHVHVGHIDKQPLVRARGRRVAHDPQRPRERKRARERTSAGDVLRRGVLSSEEDAHACEYFVWLRAERDLHWGGVSLLRDPPHAGSEMHACAMESWLTLPAPCGVGCCSGRSRHDDRRGGGVSARVVCAALFRFMRRRGASPAAT